MYTLYKQTSPIKDASGAIVGYNNTPVQVADDFFILYGLKFDWKNKTVERMGKVYYLDTLTSDETVKIPTPEEWLATYGNYIKTLYYAGGEDLGKNPSNNPNNVKQRIYYNSQHIKKYDIRYTWDANDNVATEESVAPNKEGAVNYKLAIKGVDPRDSSVTLERMYPEDTLVTIAEIVSEVSANVKTFKVYQVLRNGKNTSDFYMTSDVVVSISWEPILIGCGLRYIYDGVMSEDGFSFPFGPAGYEYSIDIRICKSSGVSPANQWRINAYHPRTLVYQGEEVGTMYTLYAEENITMDVIFEPTIFAIHIADEQGNVIGNAEATYNDTINLLDYAPDATSFSIGSGPYLMEVDAEYQMGSEIMTPTNYKRYFKETKGEPTVLTITAHMDAQGGE